MTIDKHKMQLPQTLQRPKYSLSLLVATQCILVGLSIYIDIRNTQNVRSDQVEIKYILLVIFHNFIVSFQ